MTFPVQWKGLVTLSNLMSWESIQISRWKSWKVRRTIMIIQRALRGFQPKYECFMRQVSFLFYWHVEIWVSYAEFYLILRERVWEQSRTTWPSSSVVLAAVLRIIRSVTRKRWKKSFRSRSTVASARKTPPIPRANSSRFLVARATILWFGSVV